MASIYSRESSSTRMSESELMDTEESCRMGTFTADENLNFCSDGLDHHLLLNKNLHQLRLSVVEQRDFDSASMLSDYSELSGPVSQIFRDSGLTIIGCADLAEGNSLPPRPASAVDEDLALKELRKANLLSLAAEFAQVKRMDCDALPFDLHKFECHRCSYSDNSDCCSDEEEEMCQVAANSPLLKFKRDSTVSQKCSTDQREEKEVEFEEEEEEDEDECEVWHLQRAVPDRHFEINVSKVYADGGTNCAEESNCFAQQDAHCQKLAYRSERDRVLAELSLDALGAGMGVDEGVDVRLVEDSASMQMCFRNEAALSCDSDHSDQANLENAVLLTNLPNGNLVENETRFGLNLNEEGSLQSSLSNNYSEVAYENLLQKQARLQAEARLALAQARPMARMQLEVERQAAVLRQRADPANVAATNALPQVENFFISTMSNSFESRRRKKLHQHHSNDARNVPLESAGLAQSVLERMSLAQLQVLFNQLKSRVEEYNEDLVRMLMERDDAHMEQDSMLVDVEDLTRRAHELAMRLQESQKMTTTLKGNQMKKNCCEKFTGNMNNVVTSADDSNKTVVIRVTESRVSALKARLRPNKFMSMFSTMANDTRVTQLAKSTTFSS